MEELTPEQKQQQKLLQEAIQKKVSTLKFVRTHMRWAAIVVQFVGILVSNTTVLLVGTLGFFLTYMVSIGIMEDINILIWDKSDEKKEDGEETPEE